MLKAYFLRKCEMLKEVELLEIVARVKSESSHGKMHVCKVGRDTMAGLGRETQLHFKHSAG